jgi:di/tripeptidase
VLDGLGPIGKDMHTENEQINLDSIESRGLILSEFLKTL